MSTATQATAATQEPKLHAHTQELIEKMNDMVSIDAKTGVVSFVQDAYERLLPADIPLATAKALQAHNNHLYAAAFEVVGNLSRTTAAKHKTLTATTAELPLIGKDRLDIGWNRSVERNAGLPKDGQPPEKKTVFGTMTAKLTVSGADASIGELNKVAKRQKAAALELFGTAAK
jgi:hypothetical protein